MDMGIDIDIDNIDIDIKTHTLGNRTSSSSVMLSKLNTPMQKIKIIHMALAV